MYRNAPRYAMDIYLRQELDGIEIPGMINAMKVERLSVAEFVGPLNDVEKKHAPEFVYFSGNKEIFSRGPRVAIVGTRHPSPSGVKRASRLVRELLARGVTIVSGLAEGIDTIAHTCTIEQGGTTVAVLGTPLDQFYPKKNKALQLKIMSEHLAVSQFPQGYPILRKNFPMRNRTMALLINASVIVEAGDGSGSLSQGWEALRLGRPLFILQSTALNNTISWPSEMLRYGAVILSDTDQVVENIPFFQGNPSAEVAF